MVVAKIWGKRWQSWVTRQRTEDCWNSETI